MYEVEHLFIYLLTISISSLVRCLFRFFFAHFKTRLFIFLLLCFKSSFYILDMNYQILVVQIFSPGL